MKGPAGAGCELGGNSLSMGADALIIEKLSVTFVGGGSPVHAVRDATFTVGESRICGLVGESGSGKTVTGLASLGLLDRERSQCSGVIHAAGTDVLASSERDLRRMRGRSVGIVFQDPMTALNPLLTIGAQVAETIKTHLGVEKAEAQRRAVAVLAEVGMPDPERRAKAYPHQLSGGLRQRAMIAVAIACRPRLVIADEPTTALDVTIQAQILELLRDLAKAEKMSVLLVTHDLGVVAQTCDDVAVMYAGEVVETGTVQEVLSDPKHPYTQRLLEARPRLDGWGQRLESIPGRVPSSSLSPSGCLFRERCHDATDLCTQTQELVQLGPGRSARCWQATAIKRVTQ
jgi:peptide/nickel transport system ATP-binding protein